METGAVLFGVIFVLLPVALFALAMALPAFALAFAFGGLFLLALGFTVGGASLPR